MGRIRGSAAIFQTQKGRALTSAEAKWLAGFLDAEGCFLIQENNAGTSWICAMTVGLRDDDATLLADLAGGAGVGAVRPKPPYGTSKPQVVWTVGDKLGCARLARLLDDHPLRGRKHRDAELWAEAVALWSASPYGVSDATSRRLRILAEALSAARKYDARLESQTVSFPDSALLHYLGGFFSGEGSFGLTDRQARIVIRTRRDERPLLMAFADGLGLGSVCDVRAEPPLSPVAVWNVTGARQMRRVVEVLDACGLRGRKLRQYLAWRPAALEIAAASFAGRPRDLALIADAREALRSVSKYAPEPWVPQQLPADDDVYEAYIGMLQKWAATTTGRLTGTAYNKERHPFWPTRNTIATAFGSWASALAAADLS